MALISKLPNRYPVADYNQWITGDKENLDPVLLGRMAYLGKVYKKKIHITSGGGRRSHEYQANLYAQYQNYLKTGKGNIKLAARPYTSSHEFGIAADTSTQPIRGMNNAELKKYGLCKPIRSEGWHIQPIETQYDKDFKKWEPEEDMTKDEVIEIIKSLNPIYEKLEDIPDWGRPTVAKMIEQGKIKPDPKTKRIDMSRDLLRAIVILDI